MLPCSLSRIMPPLLLMKAVYLFGVETMPGALPNCQSLSRRVRLTPAALNLLLLSDISLVFSIFNLMPLSLDLHAGALTLSLRPCPPSPRLCLLRPAVALGLCGLCRSLFPISSSCLEVPLWLMSLYFVFFLISLFPPYTSCGMFGGGGIVALKVKSHPMDGNVGIRKVGRLSASTPRYSWQEMYFQAWEGACTTCGKGDSSANQWHVLQLCH